MRVQYGLPILTAAFLTACGASQTPLAAPAPGIAPGYMRVTLKVAGTLNFATYQYLVIFNTTGNGLTPEAPRDATTWSAYSYMLETLVTNGKGTAEAVALLNNPAPHLPPAQFRISTTPAQFSFTSSGSNTELTFLFKRSIFSGIPNGARITGNWRFNAFSYDVNRNRIVDSMGGCAKCFASPDLPVNDAFDRTVEASAKPKNVDPAAKIVSVEFENAPSMPSR